MGFANYEYLNARIAGSEAYYRWKKACETDPSPTRPTNPFPDQSSLWDSWQNGYFDSMWGVD